MLADLVRMNGGSSKGARPRYRLVYLTVRMLKVESCRPRLVDDPGKTYRMAIKYEKLISPQLLAPDGTAASTNFVQWFAKNGLLSEAGRPAVFFHGTNATREISAFSPGGDGSTRTRGDAYGVAVYFTSSPEEASRFADAGAVYPVIIRGNLLRLDRVLGEQDREMLSGLAAEALSHADKARFAIGRKQVSIEDVDNAKAFFREQQDAWKEWGDGMCRAEPEVVSGGPPYVIEYTDYGAQVPVKTVEDAYTLFKAIGWECLPSLGYDGVVMRRASGNLWVALYNAAGNVKSAVGNNGLFDGAAADLVDATSRRCPVDRSVYTLACELIAMTGDTVGSIPTERRPRSLLR